MSAPSVVDPALLATWEMASLVITWVDVARTTEDAILKLAVKVSYETPFFFVRNSGNGSNF